VEETLKGFQMILFGELDACQSRLSTWSATLMKRQIRKAKS